MPGLSCDMWNLFSCRMGSPWVCLCTDLCFHFSWVYILGWPRSLGFSITAYGITRTNFLANPILRHLIVGRYTNSMFNILRTCHLFFKVTEPFYIPTSNKWKGIFLTSMKWQHKQDKPRNSKKNASFPLHERWKVGSWFSSVLLSKSIFYSTGSLELEWACMCSAINAMGLKWTLTCQDLLYYDEKALPVCIHAHARTHKHNFNFHDYKEGNFYLPYLLSLSLFFDRRCIYCSLTQSSDYYKSTLAEGSNNAFCIIIFK